jgi:uracil-DNA glycosylase
MKKIQDQQKILDQIAREIEKCDECMRDCIGKSVPGEGNPDANVVFIGEAPGKTEAEIGRPFIGRSGKLLRQLINETGLIEENVYITSPVKRLPKRGTPSPAQIAHGRNHLMKQFEVIKPKFIVLLGATAAQAVLQEKIAVTKVHGQIIEKDGKNYFLTFHPAAALRYPPSRELIKEDFKKLKKLVEKYA